MRKTKHFSKTNKKEEIDPLRSAQAAMEVLIIIGVLVIGVIIFGTFYFGNIGERSRGTAGTPGDYNQSDLEASYDKALADGVVEEVTMSGGSSHSGDGPTGNVTCNNDGDCDPGETLANCPNDCPPEVLFLNSLTFSSNPIIPFRDEDFKITISAGTNYETIDIYQLDITSDETGEFTPTTLCGFNGEYASTIYNLGTLLSDAPEHVSGTFSFSCHIEDPAVEYKFKFYARPTGLSEPMVDGEITKYFALQNLEFISVWKNGITGSCMSEKDAIVLPIHPEGTYDFYVDWGDGTTPTHITSGNYIFDHVHGIYYGPAKHTYKDKIDTHTVTITGQIEGFSFHYPGYPDIGFPLDAAKIREISQWGPLRLGNSGAYFEEASFLNITATDRLDLTGTTDLSNMFYSCSSLTDIPNINEWDVSNIRDMKWLFRFATNFNSEIDSWDVSNVTDMSNMFENAENFNQSIGSWDVSNVTDMSYMFNYAWNFDQSLEDWNVSKVTNMRSMFHGSSFNQPIDSWDVSNVTNMRNMFSSTPFNKPIDTWDVSNVTDMGTMFYFTSFNQPLASWDTSNVTNMAAMFNYATSYNQNISSWNVNNVTDWTMIFDNCPIQTEYKPPKFR